MPARLAGGLLLAPAAFERIRDAVLAALASSHRESPELPGVQLERLRLSVPDRLPVAAFGGIVQVLLQQLLSAR